MKRLIPQLDPQGRSRTSDPALNARPPEGTAAQGHGTARRVSRAGRTSGGIPFGTGTIHDLLHNRVYIGEVEHKGQVYPGEHEALLDRALFESVQTKLLGQLNSQHRLPSQMTGLLTGRIFDFRGNRMTPSHANKKGGRYRYYVSRAFAEPSVAQRRMVIAIAIARGWFNKLATGVVASIDDIARREGKHPKSIRSVLSLAFLAPDLVERMLEGGSPSFLILSDITRSLPELWAEPCSLLSPDLRA